MIHVIVKASSYIESHLSEPLNIAEIANKMEYSQFYFSRIFSEITRLSLYNYIMRRRVSYAYHLLLNETEKIIDVALACGFNSHETFIRAFRRHFNITPSEVRIHNIKKPLQIQEALTTDYLHFLAQLKVKTVSSPPFQAYFSGEPIDQTKTYSHYLIAVHSDKLLHEGYRLQGTLSTNQSILSYPLTLKPLITLETSEQKFCERFLFEQIENLLPSPKYYILSEIQAHSVTFYTHSS